MRTISGRDIEVASAKTSVKEWAEKLGGWSEYFKRKPSKDEVVKTYISAVEQSDSKREEVDCLEIYTKELVRLGIEKKKARKLLKVSK